MKVYVVTDVELGWDNVIGVYTNKEAAEKHKKSRRNGCGVIHTENLDETYIYDEEDEDEDE